MARRSCSPRPGLSFRLVQGAQLAAVSGGDADPLRRLYAGGLTTAQKITLIENPATPTDVLMIQIFQRHPGACDYAMALNPRTPPEVLTTLAESHTDYVRWAVSANPQTPLTVLVKLFEHRQPEQTYWFLRNPNLPDDLRGHLQNSK